ncbi:MAG: fucose isomerase [Alphaproteobacteria bacterium]|nr:fucose isomerase [Alphaproteobacteria bacterium]MDE2494038.1 fucose isomerase [Alphaproteobacteria bacterium]
MSTSAFSRTLGLGVIVSSREFFNAAYTQNARDQVVRQIKAMDAIPFILGPADTPNGAVETRDDAAKYARFFSEHRDAIDGIVVALPNFGDEIAVVEAIGRAGLNVPVLVQACNDTIDKVDVKGRRDAFCGKISVCNNLYQYGIAWTDTSSHTCDIDGTEFGADLDRFLRICRLVRGMKRARIGAIGARTPAFQTVRYSEKLLQKSGITVVTVDLSEILAGASALGDSDEAVQLKLAEIIDYGRIPSTIKRENIVKQAKFSVAVNRWMAENECDASCIQCWTSVQDNFGCATCLTMSMMGQRLMPSACEVDVTGAVSMYALALAAGVPPALLDWNNNYGNAAEKCVCTHCGNFPKDFIGDTPEISNLDVLGTTIGAEKCFGAVKGKVKAGEMTYFRLSTDDTAGTVHSYVGEGRFTDDPFGMDGGIAVTEIPRLRELLRHITRNGFEHHIAMVRGHYAEVVEEAAVRYLGWPIYHHGV